MVYTNKIIYASYVPGYETRNVQWTVEVECDIEKTVVTTAHIHHDNNNTAPHVTVVGPHVTGVGSYDVRMTFYSDSNFIHKIIGSQLHVPVWSQVYTKVRYQSIHFTCTHSGQTVLCP